MSVDLDAEPRETDPFVPGSAQSTTPWNVQPPRSVPAVWWQTAEDPGTVLARLNRAPFRADNPATLRSRHKGMVKLLDWLAEQPGQTWQQRWVASGADAAGKDWPHLPLEWLREQGRRQNNDRNDLFSGMLMLLCGQVIRPSYGWMCGQRPSGAWIAAQHALDPAGFVKLTEVFDARALGHRRFRREALIRIVWILLHKGGQIADITVGDCVEIDRVLKEHGRHTGHGRRQFYLLLREAGILPASSPPALRAAAGQGQLSVADLVDRQAIACRPIRDLLVDYLSERRPGMDYTSVRQLSDVLCRLFWRDLELHHPGIDSLRLPPAVAEAWKQRLRVIRNRDGNPLRPRARVEEYLLTIRSFYRDLARLAAEEPARWGPWAQPCPIRLNECDDRKARARGKAAMDQRTRTLLPTLPALVAAVEQYHHTRGDMLAAAQRTAPGQTFTAGDRLFIRRGSLHSTRMFATDAATAQRCDLTSAEERSFWAWAAVEVLRHSGIRIEELLELTHHSFIAYTLPTTGEVVPMVQIAPSKTDTERLILVSPELGEVLTAIIHRVRAGSAALPLVCAYDSLECVWSPPMPFLFQRPHGAEYRALSGGYIRDCINHVVAQSALNGPDGVPLRYTPHDFRRLFVTDAIRSGLPPHIAAAICGHASLDTTMGYAAIYPEDVTAHHRAFIARRRSQRPSEEYRDLSDTEWEEFLAHFELRKVALGTCGRDHGTPCVHENVCVRCPLLRVDPAQVPRLEEIHANLVDRLAEARQHGWLGEVAAIETSMAAAQQKLEAMRRHPARGATVHLGMPGVQRSSSPKG